MRKKYMEDARRQWVFTRMQTTMQRQWRDLPDSPEGPENMMPVVMVPSEPVREGILEFSDIVHNVAMGERYRRPMYQGDRTTYRVLELNEYGALTVNGGPVTADDVDAHDWEVTEDTRLFRSLAELYDKIWDLGVQVFQNGDVGPAASKLIAACQDTGVLPEWDYDKGWWKEEEESGSSGSRTTSGGCADDRKDNRRIQPERLQPLFGGPVQARSRLRVRGLRREQMHAGTRRRQRARRQVLQGGPVRQTDFHAVPPQLHGEVRP